MTIAHTFKIATAHRHTTDDTGKMLSGREGIGIGIGIFFIFSLASNMTLSRHSPGNWISRSRSMPPMASTSVGWRRGDTRALGTADQQGEINPMFPVVGTHVNLQTDGCTARRRTKAHKRATVRKRETDTLKISRNSQH